MTPESLRAFALEALGPHADARAHEALVRAEVVIVPNVAHWEGPRGLVVAHRVGLGLSASDLARLVDAHNVKAELIAAMAAAVASQGEVALADLVLFWSPAARDESGGYRGRTSTVDLAVAVEAFLRARGEDAAADVARHARFEVEGDTVTGEGGGTREEQVHIASALRILLSHLERRAVHVAWKPSDG